MPRVYLSLLSDDTTGCSSIFRTGREKNNNRRNRQLIADMLKSAMEVLTEPVVDSVTASSSPDDVSYIVPPGEIHVALVEHQGGVTSRSDQEWKMSWMVPVHAAAAGLLQVGLEPFQVSYSRASYRGVDKPFHVKEMPQLHIFAKSDGVLECPKSLQLCCRFELHISLPPQKDENCWNDTKTKRRQLSRDEILDAYIIRSHVQPLMPRGMEADVSFAGVFTRGQVDCDGLSSAAHLIVLRGVRRPVVREECDALRAKIEEAMLEICSLRGDKTGRMVSKPIPYDLLRRKWEADENNGVDARSWGSR
uniref:Uncharacterized protein n=1 Tax=Corethron hystrix TaxID=216773 RepID=A0A7S1FQ40_9STRA|mmetsp:Transcript_18701/g.42703  ORF Transcript_18701/g.42703 Transcript_18701/m.42703 type:complete len:306 (+) Transcript_18701:637-1554(+)